jgi:hypothetical protein
MKAMAELNRSIVMTIRMRSFAAKKGCTEICSAGVEYEVENNKFVSHIATHIVIMSIISIPDADIPNSYMQAFTFSSTVNSGPVYSLDF